MQASVSLFCVIFKEKIKELSSQLETFVKSEIFDRVYLERKTEGMIPDVILEVKKSKLIIELG